MYLISYDWIQNIRVLKIPPFINYFYSILFSLIREQRDYKVLQGYVDAVVTRIEDHLLIDLLCNVIS